MAKTSGGSRPSIIRGGRLTGGRVSVGRLRQGDQVFRPGDSLGRGGFTVDRVNSSTIRVATGGGGTGRISRRDLVGGYVMRRNNRFTRIGR